MSLEQGDERLTADRENLREIAVGAPLSSRLDRGRRWFCPCIRNADTEMLRVDGSPELARPRADRHTAAGGFGRGRRCGQPSVGVARDPFQSRGAKAAEPHFERSLNRQYLQSKRVEMIGTVTRGDALTRPPPPRQRENLAHRLPAIAGRVTEHCTFCGLSEARYEGQQQSPTAHSIELCELAREQPWVTAERHHVCAELQPPGMTCGEREAE